MGSDVLVALYIMSLTPYVVLTYFSCFSPPLFLPYLSLSILLPFYHTLYVSIPPKPPFMVHLSFCVFLSILFICFPLVIVLFIVLSFI